MAPARTKSPRAVRGGRRRALLAVLSLLGCLIGFAVIEAGLRIAGFVPWTFLATERDEPTLCTPDPTLGWRNRPGDHALPAFVPDVSPSEIHVLPDASRATGVVHAPNAPGFLLVGGSYVYGWGIDDDETCAAELQRRFPELHVSNHGTPAYGTYQSLLRLEQVLPDAAPPRFVLYGFLEDHENRNVASAGWLRVLSLFNQRGHVATPFVSQGPSGLERHPPLRHWMLPGRELLAAVNVAGQVGMQLSARARTAKRREITEALLVEMQRVVSSHGARFVVALLEASRPTRRHYGEFLVAHRIPYIDVAFPRTAAYKIAGEEHPNGAMNARWAEGIEQAFEAWGWR